MQILSTISFSFFCCSNIKRITREYGRKLHSNGRFTIAQNEISEPFPSLRLYNKCNPLGRVQNETKSLDTMIFLESLHQKATKSWLKAHRHKHLVQVIWKIHLIKYVCDRPNKRRNTQCRGPRRCNTKLATSMDTPLIDLKGTAGSQHCVF